MIRRKIKLERVHSMSTYGQCEQYTKKEKESRKSCWEGFKSPRGWDHGGGWVSAGLDNVP